MNIGIDAVKQILMSKTLCQYRKVYTKFEEIVNELPSLPLREQMKDEIIIESDSYHKGVAHYQMRYIIRRLKRDNITFFLFDHKGKSPHLHIYDIKGLDKLDSDIRSMYIHKFMNKYAPQPEIDRSFCKSRQLIASEFQQHWKTDDEHKYGVKQLIGYNIAHSNTLDTSILKDCVVQKQKIYKDTIPSYTKWLILMAMNEPFPRGNVDLIMFKNVMISVCNIGIQNVNEVIDQMASQYKGYSYRHYNEGSVRQKLKAWYRWAIAQPRSVSYSEIDMWFENHNLSIQQYKEKYNVKWNH